MSSFSQLPGVWQSVQLGEVAKFINGDRGKNYPSQDAFVSTGIPFINAGHIKNGNIDLKSMNYVSRERFDLLGSGKIQSNDILYCLRGSLGKTAVIREIDEGAIASSLVIIRPSNKIDTDYLYHYLVSPRGKAEIWKYDNGSSQPNLSAKSVKGYKIPLPSLEEQKRIAAILDKADAIRRKRREAIALTEELLRSTFLDMFGDPVANPKRWDSGTILDVVSDPKTGVRCGPFGTQLKVHELVSEGIPLYGIENVKGGKLIPATTKYLTELKAEELSAFDVKTDDVLVTRMGTIGHACVIPKGIEEARISCHLFRIRSNPKKCLPGFLAATITRSGTFMRQLQRLSHGAIMSGLKTGDLKEVRFLIPPIEFQKEYLQVVEQTDQTISHQNQALEEEEILFNSLLQKSFRGEL